MNENGHTNHAVGHTNDAVMGFVAGAVLGAGLALLFAPADGRETRRKLAKTARRLREGTNEKVAKIKASVVSHAAGVQDDVREAIEVGRAAAVSKR